MFNFQLYPQKKYSGIEIYDILQHSAIKGTVQRYCVTAKDYNECSEYIRHMLSINELTSDDIVLIIRGRTWENFLSRAEQNKEKKLKEKCTCEAYDLLRSKGCTCGHIIPYKPKNIFI